MLSMINQFGQVIVGILHTFPTVQRRKTLEPVFRYKSWMRVNAWIPAIVEVIVVMNW